MVLSIEESEVVVNNDFYSIVGEIGEQKWDLLLEHTAEDAIIDLQLEFVSDENISLDVVLKDSTGEELSFVGDVVSSFSEKVISFALDGIVDRGEWSSCK